MDPVNEHLEIADLIAKHFRGLLTGHEKAALTAWINASAENQRLWEQLNDDELLREKILSMPDAGSTGAAWDRLHSKLTAERPRPHIGHRIFLYAAAITGMLLGVASLIYLLLHRPDATAPPAIAKVEAPAPQPITPGSSKARLVLGNGKVVELKDNAEQAFTEEDGTHVKSSAAVLSYSAAGTTDAPVYNTLETPRGGEYRVVLPDSSVVWLNAASSLRFPTRFSGGTRKVYLSGEAYFEIAKNRNKPFIVSINNMSVTVTGTQFNVKGYPDETYVNTTLVEGGVELRTADNPAARPVLLQPGYQGVWENRKITVKEAYLEEALAWKNGLFVFRSEPIGSIMRKLSRWYDVEVTFADASLTQLRFTGTIRKYESIQKVLEMLALTQKVKFRIDDKKISVLKANSQ
jgi:ferric-dicitrate binding protein FerR (iron transport regulator)